MTRPELDRMLEKAVAEAIGVPYRNAPAKRTQTLRAPGSYRIVPTQHVAREMQHA